MENVKAYLNTVHLGPYPGTESFLEEYVKGRTVLDIGVVEHDLSFVNRPGWKHKQLKELASKIVGVDVVEEAVSYLNQIGFDVRLCDATSNIDLGDRFDTVFVGDVIEHVNNPVKLLQFAARHLKEEGRIVVTTPCPFWWQNISLMVKNQTYIGNVDHISWITPINALELSFRANLRLDHYYTIETHGSSVGKKAVKWGVEKLLGKTELFTWAYAYVFTNVR